MELLCGFSRDEVIGHIWHHLLQTEFPRPLAEIEAELLAREEWAGRLTHRRHDGRPVTVDSRWILCRGRDGQDAAVIEISGDVTEARLDQDARLQLASIVECSDDAIIGTTLDAVVTSWNRAAEGMFGYAAAEMLGQPVTCLLPPDRAREEALILDRIRRGERVEHYETVRRRRDGSAFEVALTVSPIRDASGGIVGASKIVRDVTAQKQAESRIRQLQVELAHVARLNTMGQMASALAHEVNQPLTAIVSYAAALSRLFAAGKFDPLVAGDLIGRIREQSLRAGEVIRRIREFAAKRGADRTSEDLNRIVEEATALALIGTRHHGIQTVMQFDRTLGPVFLDRVQIGQVVVNLVRNAVEAMEGSERRELFVSTHAHPDARTVEIRVSDTGPGIPPAVAERLFQPFVTSKHTGLGVGLSICREIVAAHGGEIAAAPRPEGGTVFAVTLPAADDAEGGEDALLS